MRFTRSRQNKTSLRASHSRSINVLLLFLSNMKKVFSQIVVFGALYLIFMVPAYLNRQAIEDSLAEQYHWNRYNLNKVNSGTDTLSSSGAVLPSKDKSEQSDSRMQTTSIRQAEKREKPAEENVVAMVAMTKHDNTDIRFGSEVGQIDMALEQSLENKVAALGKQDEPLEDRAK